MFLSLHRFQANKQGQGSKPMEFRRESLRRNYRIFSNQSRLEMEQNKPQAEISYSTKA